MEENNKNARSPAHHKLQAKTVAFPHQVHMLCFRCRMYSNRREYGIPYSSVFLMSSWPPVIIEVQALYCPVHLSLSNTAQEYALDGTPQERQ